MVVQVAVPMFVMILPKLVLLQFVTEHVAPRPYVLDSLNVAKLSAVELAVKFKLC